MILKLHKISTGYDIIPRCAVESLSSADAIAIYTVLLTRPQDWTIRKTWVQERLGIGGTRYANAVNELKSKGFWTTQTEYIDGRLAGKTVVFDPLGNLLSDSLDSEIRSAENQNFGKPRTSGNPEPREIDTLKETETELKNKRDIFRPPTVDEVSAYLKKRGSSVDPEQFVDFYAAKGWMIGKNKMIDWEACVRTWEKIQKQREKKDEQRRSDSQSNADKHREATRRIQEGLHQALVDDGFFGEDETDVQGKVDFASFH